MTDTSEDRELENFSFEYDPQKVLKTQWHGIWILLLVIFLMSLGVAATLGFMRLKNFSFPIVEPESTPEADVIIAGTITETVLLLVDTNDTSTQIKIASTTTDTVVVQDLSRGSFKALTGALSPSKDRVVYIKEENGHRAIAVINPSTGNNTPLESSKLTAAAQGIQIEPCSWSSIAWSSDGKRFAFFGCDRSFSELVVVEAETELTPIVLKNTQAAQTPARQLFWLTSESLIYTHVDSATAQTWISRIGIQSDSIPLLVYSR